MILLSISDASAIFSLHPLIDKAFDYISLHDLSSQNGRIEIDGDNLYINVGSNELVPHCERKIELHRRYIDIHIPISGSEIIGWRAAGTLQKVDTMYDQALDYAFYGDTPSTYVTVAPGEFLIATPADGHAPLIGSGNLFKAVVKIRL